MHYFKYHIGDFAIASRHMTPLENIAYIRMLELYYDTETPIVNDVTRISKRIGMREYIEEIQSVIDEFFIAEDGGLVNLNAKKEIRAYQENAEKARANGRKGGRPKNPDETGLVNLANPDEPGLVNLANPDETGLKANQEPVTINDEPVKINDEPDKTYVHFDDFWNLYPRKTNKVKAKAAWTKLKPDNQLFETIARNIHGRLDAGDWDLARKDVIPHATTYLNNCRWDDEIIMRSQNETSGYSGRSVVDRVNAGISKRSRERAKAIQNSGRTIDQDGCAVASF